MTIPSIDAFRTAATATSATVSAVLVAKDLQAAVGDRVLFSGLDLVVESALATYPGTFLLVSHDRRMLDAVMTTRRIEVADGHITSR